MVDHGWDPYQHFNETKKSNMDVICKIIVLFLDCHSWALEAEF